MYMELPFIGTFHLDVLAATWKPASCLMRNQLRLLVVLLTMQTSRPGMAETGHETDPDTFLHSYFEN